MRYENDALCLLFSFYYYIPLLMFGDIKYATPASIQALGEVGGCALAQFVNINKF